MRLLSLILILSGCARPGLIKTVSINPELKQYVDEFIDEGKRQGNIIIVDNLSVQFTTKLDEDTLGVCLRYSNGTTPHVQINLLEYQIESYARKKVVMFHELSHCILNRSHINTWLGGIVTSIMYPYIERDDMYLNNWDYYMRELFYGY